MGSKKNAMWRVVVADQRSPRDGRFIEMIGHYNPHTQPSQIVIDRDRLDHWISKGAEPSDTVRKLMRAPNSQSNAPAVAEAPAEEVAAPEAAGTPPSEGTGTPPSEGTGDVEAAAPSEAESTPEASADAPPSEGTGEEDTPADADGDADAAPESGNESG